MIPIDIQVSRSKVKNKTNHPISSNNHPSETANIAIHCLKRGGIQNQQLHVKGHVGILHLVQLITQELKSRSKVMLVSHILSTDNSRTLCFRSFKLGR